MTDFVADFAFNSTEKKVYSKTAEHANPAIRLAVNERSTMQTTPWIFYHYPDLFEIKDSKYAFELVGYKPKKFTGLQIAKNPGVNIVWIGSTMIVVGITLSSVYLSPTAVGKDHTRVNAVSRCISAGRRTKVRSIFKKSFGN